MCQRPNILFIVTDQEYAHQSLPKGVVLPNRQRLKERGVTFENYQVTTTLCTPSRACMYTGQHTAHNGMVENANYSFIGELDPEIPTMGDLLREAGYYTAYKGKWHLGRLSYQETTPDALEPYGFADFQTTGDTHGLASEGAWRDAEFAADAAAWLHAHNEIDRPWFLAVNFINPHDIMFYYTGDGHSQGSMNVAREPEGNVLYEERWAVELPVSFDDDGGQQPAAVQAYKAASDAFYGRIPIEREDLWGRHINYYLNCLIDVDQHLGTVLDALEASGQMENTVIVFTSDHGELAGAHQLVQKGMVVFRELVNVPLIVVHPEGQKGVRTAAVGSAVDLIPTMLRWAGSSSTQYPALVGRDLTPVIFDTDQAGPRGNPDSPGDGALLTYDRLSSYDSAWFKAVYADVIEISGTGEQKQRPEGYLRDTAAIFAKHGQPDMSIRHMLRGVFDGRYKLIRYFALDNYHLPQTVEELLANNDVALYDLVDDPHEMVNLVSSASPELLAELNDKLNHLIAMEIGADVCPYGL